MHRAGFSSNHHRSSFCFCLLHHCTYFAGGGYLKLGLLLRLTCKLDIIEDISRGQHIVLVFQSSPMLGLVDQRSLGHPGLHSIAKFLLGLYCCLLYRFGIFALFVRSILTLIFATKASCTASWTRTLFISENESLDQDQDQYWHQDQTKIKANNKTTIKPVCGNASLSSIAELARHAASHLGVVHKII